MSRWAIRMCSSKCQGVYGTFGGSRLMASSGKSATAASNGRWAPCPSMSARSCSRRMSLAAIWSLLLDSSARGLTLRCSWLPGKRPPRWSLTMLPHRPSFVPVAACGDTMWSWCGLTDPADRSMWGWRNAEEAGAESAAETAGPLLVGADRPQEVDLAEGGPVDLAEVELAVDALPGQEAAEAHLAGGSNYQVRVRAARRVQVALHCVRGQTVGQFRGADAFAQELADGRPCRLDEFFTAAVAA